ncbi:MAG TPA: hypothetical protein PLU30_27435 [Verrucomicrobiae bacterium]|nr:hypothetical protein [Verrucomicrobiae bacterium]
MNIFITAIPENSHPIAKEINGVDDGPERRQSAEMKTHETNRPARTSITVLRQLCNRIPDAAFRTTWCRGSRASTAPMRKRESSGHGAMWLRCFMRS